MKHIEDIASRQVRLWEARGRAARDVRAAESPPCRPIVALSRQEGCGGHAVARRVADGLGFPLFDREILSWIARRGAYVESMLATVDERGRNWIEDSLRTLFSDDRLSRSEYNELLTRAVLAISSLQGAVVVGRGADRILPRERRLAVRLVAPEAWRVHKLAAERELTASEALEAVRASDEERRRFVRTEFGADIDDALAYDLVLDASRFGEDALVAIVTTAYRSL